VSSNGFDNYEIVCTLADEAHQAWKSLKSAREKVFAKLIQVSAFTVLVSGTPFPLGPQTDAKGVLRHLGGPFEGQSKWSPKLQRAFSRLTSKGGEHWDIKCFRVLIAPFCLRRTERSTWEGDWIIKRQIRIPLPSILVPYEDTASETIARNRYRDGIEPATLIQRIERASKERCMAWSPLFAEIEDQFPQAKAGSPRYDQSTCEKILESRLKRQPATGRLRRLIALIKSIRGNGERFVIVSDRLFLVTLAFYVLSPLSTLIH